MNFPYNLPPKVATILAQICCFNNELPQGAPTSPVISNMICAKLDGELIRLAKKNKCSYSRYADDITFSTKLKKFPYQLAIVKHKQDEKIIKIGKNLEEIITENGFKINNKKVYLFDSSYSQKVTGITVNKSPNLPRKFIRQVRAMLYSWGKHGLQNAEDEYLEKYNKKQRNPERPDPSFKKVVEGKINYIRMVKGSKDIVFKKLANKYYNLIGKPFPKFSINEIEEISAALWVLLECDEPYRQGSAFMLHDIGLVTCQHVLGPKMVACRHDNINKKYEVEIISKNEDIDLAILNIKGVNNLPSLSPCEESNHKHRDKVTLAGFPNYRIGDTPYISDGNISGFRPVSGINWILINSPIVQGNSGGPVLNSENKVIGIAATGTDRIENASKTEHHGVIPISALKNLTIP